MKGFFVCRIIEQLKSIEYKHVRECTCGIYHCDQNNIKYQERTENYKSRKKRDKNKLIDNT